jgi:hypothetical protein
MFTNADTIDLLTAIAAYDGRAPSEAAVIAWREAGDRAHWSLPKLSTLCIRISPNQRRGSCRPT